MSRMIYGDYLTPWITHHPNRPKTRFYKSGAFLLKVSYWGDDFLQHWAELDKLSVADNSYSELYYDLDKEQES